MKKLTLLTILVICSILLVGCGQPRDQVFNCDNPKTYCESLLLKDDQGRVSLNQTIMENSFYEGISCNDWSIRCGWYPME